MTILIRNGIPSDRNCIAENIADVFHHQFRALTHSTERIAAALSNGVNPARFVIALEKETNRVVGTVGIADQHGYPMVVVRSEVIKTFDWFRGSIASFFIADEFIRPKKLEQGQGHIAFVAVREKMRGQGIARKMIQMMLSRKEYCAFTLDVVEGNEQVLPLYRSLGFQDIGRVKERLGWLTGVHFRYWMKFRR